MASIANDPGGRRRILFVAPDESRRAIRLGKCDRKTAEAIARHVEALLAAKIGAQPIAREMAVWLANIGATLRDKLARVELVEAPRCLTAGEYLLTWLDEKEAAGFKPTSLRAWRQTADNIFRLFNTKPLTDLSHADGEAFRTDMQGRGLRATTVHKRLGHARAMLQDAVRLGHIPANPWQHVRQRAGDPSERRAYIPVEDAERVLEHCPNVWWRLLVALARFGGVRVPSEALSLTWADVDWERGRLCIPSPKTEHTGKSHRIIPMFPLLRPHLEAAFVHAADGDVHVFLAGMRRAASGPMGWGGANLRTTFAKIVRKSGVEPWPRIWHSLRASRESDLVQSFPLAIVTKWLGNTPSVALRPYVDPTEAAFEQARAWQPARAGGARSGAPAAQKAAQQAAARPRKDSHDPSKTSMELGNLATHCESLHILAHDKIGSVWESNPPATCLQAARRF
jgi:integrase